MFDVIIMPRCQTFTEIYRNLQKAVRANQQTNNLLFEYNAPSLCEKSLKIKIRNNIDCIGDT